MKGTTAAARREQENKTKEKRDPGFHNDLLL